MSERFVILVADDEQGALDFYRRLFPDEPRKLFDVLGDEELSGDDRGYRITCRLYLDAKQLVADYREDMRQGIRHPLCVLDMHMSTEDEGLTTAQQLREIDEDIDIVFATAMSKVSPEDVRTKLRERVFFVGKPFAPDEFILLVQSLVGYWQSRRNLKLQKERVSQQEALMGTLLDYADDLIFMKNRKGIYLMCNDLFARFAKRTKEDIIGATDYNFLPKDISDKFRDEDNEVMSSVSTQTFRDEVDHPDGTRCLLETVKSPVRSESGECIGLIGVARDISARGQDDTAVTI